MVILVTEAMERAPSHPSRLIKAAPPRNQALLDLCNRQVRAVLRIATLRSISNTKTAPAADLTPTCEPDAGAPAAARADHPNTMSCGARARRPPVAARRHMTEGNLKAR